MARKTFLIIAAILTVAALAGWVIKYQTPTALQSAGWKDFPTTKDGWTGSQKVVAPEVIDLLKPDHIIDADYLDLDGNRINLFLGSFSDPRGGPHSPLNCLPASGWILEGTEPHTVNINGRTLSIKRLHLRFRQSVYVMDFWYVTPWGETSSDYQLKLFEMMTSLTLSPRHLTFVRFVGADTPEGLAALERFENTFLDDIYRRLPVSLQ
jgi:EpsI family protein